MAYIRDLERDLIFDYGTNGYKSATHDISKISDGENLYSIKDNYAYHEGELATVATTGNYNDLTNTPTIPAAQIQSDWNATTGMGVILNKPTIPTVDQTYNASSANAQSGVAIEGMMTTKFQVVDELPANPVSGVFYFIKE